MIWDNIVTLWRHCNETNVLWCFEGRYSRWYNHVAMHSEYPLANIQGPILAIFGSANGLSTKRHLAIRRCTADCRVRHGYHKINFAINRFIWIHFVDHSAFINKYRRQNSRSIWEVIKFQYMAFHITGPFLNGNPSVIRRSTLLTWAE